MLEEDTKDLGTYHIKVELKNERGFYYRWNTGCYYTGGSSSSSPIDANRISPGWEDEEELIQSIVYTFTEGNYSCDCNLKPFIADAYQEEHEDDYLCGDTIELERLTLIRPDGSEVIIYDLAL